MCGIAGFVGEGDLATLTRMTDALSHRGPDGRGVWHDPAAPVYLGHRRLSIIDHSGGTQPMWTADGALGVVFNGEIYNHAELRAELKALGHVFQTDHSDTEVLLHGYREWGVDLTSRLNGMWAFVIHDRSQKRLFGSRDRFGKKPFYYLAKPGIFAFASELDALIEHPRADRRLSRRALQKYFAYNAVPTPLSIYEDISRLPGGYSFIYRIDHGELQLIKYWDFVIEPFDTIPADAERVWGEQLRDLLDRAVQRRLMADVPLGTFLSGGIDSSAVTAFAARHVPPGQLKTFSIGFDEASFDESGYAREVAELLGTEHHPEHLSIERARELLPRIVDKLDEPLGDSSLLPTYLLCEHARKTVTVALGGDGADELFAGYDPFRALSLARAYERIVPRPVHEAIRLIISRLPVSHRYMSLDFRLKRTLRGLSHPPRLWCPVWMASLAPDEIADLFAEPVDPDDLFAEAIEQWDACAQANLVDRTLQFYTRIYLQDDILVKVDRASMMHGLEARAPFLDIELVDFVRRIPHAYKYRNGQTKYLLKKALEPVLPGSVLYRSKQGFGVPVGRWFHDGLLDLSGIRGVAVDPGFAARRLDAHRQGRSDERAFLWNAWILEHWAESRHLR